MSADQETVTADQPTRFPTTRAEALRAWEAFRPRAVLYAGQRNGVRPGHAAVSRLSPAIRQRLVTEYEIIASTLAVHPFASVEKFLQELLWRRYWKSWLELRPSVWSDYRAAAARLRDGLRGYQARRVEQIEEGRCGVEIMDYFTRELRETGYLHNHARMWFAGFWVHTERLPWEIGADFFYRHLLDADPASNTLSWRWVAGIQTRGKAYLTRRSNLERFLAPELLATYPGHLDRLDDRNASPAPMDDAAEPPRPSVPEGAQADPAQALDPARLGPRPGVWVHGDDLCVENAGSPLANLRPRAVFAGIGAGLLRDFRVSEPRREYLRATVRDGLTRAGEHFGAEATYVEPESLPESLAAWARSRGLTSVVALCPPVGPLRDALPALETSLRKTAIPLVLVWRPEDARVLPLAKSGYFNFWRDASRLLLPVAGGPEPPPASSPPLPARPPRGRRRRD